MYPNGKYINSKLILCHNPSFAMMVLENSGLSDKINNTKNRKANIKEITDITPVILSLSLNESMANNSLKLRFFARVPPPVSGVKSGRDLDPPTL